jgi:uncharacterized protein (TIGR04255 family)
VTYEHDPLVDPPPTEVPLQDAPLVRVICQIRFPLIASVGQQDFIAPFQTAVREEYPVLRLEQAPAFTLGSMGFGSMPISPQIAWRFLSQDGAWRLTLTSDFLTLETTRYTSRTDFLGRIGRALQSLKSHIHPAQVDRLGIRYIDRVTGDALKTIETLVRAEVRGVTGSVLSKHMQHALTEALFKTEESQLLARWGHLPPNGTVDPTAVEPISTPSWILDLDMFSTTPCPFDVPLVLEKTTKFAERIYSMFRWAVSDEFLRLYGGEV